MNPEHRGSGRTAAKAGPRIYNLFPLLVGPVSAWRGELARIAGMNFDWVYLNPFHEAGFSGSLYAVKDPYRLDPRFRDADGGDDDAQIAGFAAAAGGHGLKVMTDLVVNHTSKDALLAAERPDVFRRNEAGELMSPHAIDPIDPSVRTEWGDLAELDYARGDTRAFLIGYWDRYVAHLQRLGVKGFRCDAAYKVPADVWRSLIGAAKERDRDCLFAAETLGCTFDETREVAGAGFDFLFNSFAWWDFREPWALEQYEALRLVAPSISFPENHDMGRVAAEFGEDDARIARELKARYALAAFFSTGVLMPIGYEWGYRRPLHVVETRPGDREVSTIDISAFVGGINRVRAGLPAVNVEGEQRRLATPGQPSLLALLRCDSGHPATALNATLVLANLGTASLAIDPGPLIVQTGGALGRFSDATPGAAAVACTPGRPLALGPGEVRIFSARGQVSERPRSRGRAPSGDNRVIIENVSPQLDGGATPIKSLVGEVVEVAADIFSDGHDKIAADIVYRASGEFAFRRAPMRFVDNDRWAGTLPLERNARYSFAIEAWRDPFASWLSEVEKKAAAGQDVRLKTIEGVHIAQAAAERAAAPDKEALAHLVVRLRSEKEGSAAQLGMLLNEPDAALIARHAERQNLTRHEPTLEVIADRLAARYSAWYELFPRSQSGDAQRHGTFDDVIARLPYVRDMGFDVLYFPPIHPIGTTNRKGKNNSLQAGPGDVGSVYAIGAEAGGHDAIHPDLGTLADFRRLTDAAHAHGLEIALDFAIQCSPDHPWIKEHPEWFEWRPDGTLKFAENPPKKYEDIVNVHFYGEALPSLWIALRDVVLFWARERVRIFRVDNPHTKPLPFWRWLIREVNDRYPDAIFLAEAFTRPKMMKALAKAGFQQSYTYFTWRNTKQEIIDYMTELATTEMAGYYRPNFFANTPDINPFYLQTSGPQGFVVRATLAATLSSAWGIYSGFELAEGRPIPGREEYLDSEKYEIRAWDWNRPGNIHAHVTALNAIRRANPALQDFTNILFLDAGNEHILAYARMTPARDNCILVMVNLDPRNRQECSYEVPLWEFGLPDHAAIEAEDLLQGGRFTLYGKTHRIALDPAERPVVLWRLVPPSR